jgi:hypothetical protein
LNSEIRREDDVMRRLREDDTIRGIPSCDFVFYKVTILMSFSGKTTSEYASFLAKDYVEPFRSTSTTHHICIPPIFFPSGDLVDGDELPARLDNAIVEIMFTLQHFYYAYKGKSPSNSYMAVIQQAKILFTAPPSTSADQQLIMKTIVPTPPSQKGKQTAASKRYAQSPPPDASPSASKKIRLEGCKAFNFFARCTI